MIVWREEMGLWWPEYDRQDIARAYRWLMQRVTDSDVMLPHCRKRGLCVQAGGMVGLWPQRLARAFDFVMTFEPDAACFAALKRNVSPVNVVARPYALGAEMGQAIMRRAPSAGSWRIRDDGDVSIEVVTIDSRGLDVCDAIVLDVEGHEAAALRGAARTIERFRPVLMVEEWDAEASGKFMSSIGYRKVASVHRDAVYVSAR